MLKRQKICSSGFIARLIFIVIFSIVGSLSHAIASNLDDLGTEINSPNSFFKSKVELEEELHLEHSPPKKIEESATVSRGPASTVGETSEITQPEKLVGNPGSDLPLGLDERPPAVIDEMLTPQRVRAVSFSVAWSYGEVVAFKSSDPKVGVIGYGSIDKIDSVGDQTLLYVKLLRQSRHFLIRPGDGIIHLPLLGSNEHYNGSTDLLIQPQAIEVSSRYKNLITLGISAGETAQTLWKNEKMITFYGQLFYGVTDRWTLTTIAPGFLVNAPNLGGKTLVYKSESNAVSIGGLATKIPDSDAATVNLTFMWDSVSSGNVITHTLLSLAVLTFDRATESTAIKSLGTSSLQNSYEFILSNWDRFIVGPSYNFEKKALGGYASYYMIWDHYHLGFSLNSTNISSFKLSSEDGYFAGIDSYWRF